MTFREVDDLTLAEWSVLNRSFIDQPPVDILVAAYLGYKAPTKGSNNFRDAARANSAALQSSVHPRVGTFGQFLGRKSKTINQMPEYVRSPEKMELIARMKAEMEGTDG